MFVEDYSNNGTFVDGVLVGKNHKLPLVNNAVVALAEPRNKGGSDWGSAQVQTESPDRVSLSLCLQSLSSLT